MKSGNSRPDAIAPVDANKRGAESSAAVPTEAEMRILTVTTLFPNVIQPGHGVFVENRIRHLTATNAVHLQVVAPVPWFPTTNSIFGRYAAFAKVPPSEIRHEIPVTHPRYLALPKIGVTAAPFFLGMALLGEVQSLRRAGKVFDVIDAHYFYPDGVAAIWVGRRLRIPVVITARGSDLNYYVPHHPLARRMIRWAAKRAAGLITVCQALKDVLVDLDISESRIHVLRNGVDLELFRPLDRFAVRQSLELKRLTLLSVGHLIARKGHDVALRAIAQLPEIDLLVVGEGPERSRLELLARALGVADRVRFLGQVPHRDLPNIYSAADALVLASSREGWANVLLEAMACGTPAVASNVWGTPEVVSTPAAGLLVPDRTPAAFADAVRRLFAQPPDRAATRAHAENFSWDATTQGQLTLFRSVIDNQGSRRSSSGAP